MSQTIYRKYRPQKFSEVIGQNHIKITLQNEIASGQIAHAYLFTGPHGIGKTSLARIFAKALNCKQRKEKEFEPCDACDACQSIIAGKNLDLIEIDAATNTQVDKVRENIIENVRFSPHADKYKIFIIDEVHMLSTSAFNALLKTLEEPPAYAIFILCTTELHKLPETIISRCQRFDFSKVGADEIVKKLRKIVDTEKIKVSDEVLKIVAFRSGGFIRDAESLLGQIITLLSNSHQEITIEDIEPVLPRSDLDAISNLTQALIDNDAKSGIEIINNLISEGIDIERFNLDLIDYLRKIILIKTNLKDRDYSIAGLPEKIQTEILSQSEEIDFTKLINILEKFISKQTVIKESEIPQLPLEMAIIELTTFNQQSIISNQTITLKQKNSSNGKEIKTNKEINKSHNNIVNEQKSKNKKNTEEVAIKSEKEVSKNTEINITLEEIKNKWSDLLHHSQEVNHSLPVILKSAYPYKLDGNKLKLAFSAEIFANKLKEEKTLIVAEKLLKTVFKNNIKIDSIVIGADEFNQLEPLKIIPKAVGEQTQTSTDLNKNLDNNKSAPNDNTQINELINSFGGKIVE